MTVVRSTRAAAARAAGAAGQALRLALLGGPMGVFLTLRLRYLQRRQQLLALYMEREKEYHRMHMAALRYEMSEVLGKQQATAVAAAQFWGAMGGRP